MLQVILVCSSLLLVLSMCASLMWLAAGRAAGAADGLPAQAPEADA